MKHCSILVVEDEIFVATDIESMVADLGHRPVGIAADAKTALDLAPNAEIALVDLNLRDGPTGQFIGRTLAETYGITVLFMTANPSQLGDGIPGTIGVLPKPVMEDELKEAVAFAVAHRSRMEAQPPARLRLFAPGNANDAEMISAQAGS
ncbi:response regulator [Oryzicola mucosus]|uniref:Response regulator n=1 Tax=Oryzicola mucosus TaxID=2767425 RepID=A0A8J6U4R1_9HYPH|nr:response regulator [Oryzicola mucosus]MBD0414865.1 response regulator [Oryzicola mucosus]